MDDTVTDKPRHYATIGIDDVFLEPPKHAFPKSYLLLDNEDNTSTTVIECFVSSEIIGTIKEHAEDFCVREIAKKGRDIPGMVSDAERQAFRVADIMSLEVLEEPKKETIVNQTADSDKPNSSTKETVGADTAIKINIKPKTEHIEEDAAAEMDSQVATQETVLTSQTKTETVAPIPTKKSELPPMELLEAVFLELVPEHDIVKAEKIMESLQSLEKRAKERTASASIKSDNKGAPGTAAVPADYVFIPAIPPDFSHLESIGILVGVDRRAFHEAFRLSFSLLKCETVPEHTKQVRISADDFFDDLIPLLYKPQEDIAALFRFHKRGFIDLPQSSRNHQGGKRKRDRDVPDDPLACGEPILRLRPELSKDDRRPIHRIIAQKNRAFQTRTLSNHPLDPANKEITTNAIQVHWSFGALKRAQQKKFKPNKQRNNSAASKEADPNPHTICVLKKREKEHLTAINAVCSAVKCSTSDVGLAGIKDMKAVTYQFCTLRNVNIGRLRRAIPYLKGTGIEIGTMRKAGFMLQNGDLQGNRFRIVVRGMKRVHVERKEAGQLVEEFRPCEKKHMQEMFERVQRSGFINFYGEQRVGVPGQTSEVGVRTFDVGRAMLQGDFTKAIDLLMTGRSILYSRDAKPNPAETKARQVWKETNDATATLKAFPKGETMPRERAVLKGLKRYGKEEPLAAIQCLPHNVRRFWINAYQSRIWNSAASARVRRYGSSSPVIGDLFMEEGAANINNVKIIDSENIASVTLDQVVLPLPGFGIRYPENDIGGDYKRLLEEDKVVLDKNGPAEGTAKGAYRHLLAKAEHMEVEFGDDLDDSLCASSMIVSFDLPAGSYATMLLRELMGKTVVRD